MNCFIIPGSGLRDSLSTFQDLHIVQVRNDHRQCEIHSSKVMFANVFFCILGPTSRRAELKFPSVKRKLGSSEVETRRRRSFFVSSENNLVILITDLQQQWKVKCAAAKFTVNV